MGNGVDDAAAVWRDLGIAHAVQREQVVHRDGAAGLCGGGRKTGEQNDERQDRVGRACAFASCTLNAHANAYPFLTSNDFVPAGVPLSDTSTLYWPSGQPSGFAIWNSVVAAPLGAIWRLSSFTTWPSAP